MLAGSLLAFLMVDGESQAGRLRWICVGVILLASPALGRIAYLFEDSPVGVGDHGAALGFGIFFVSITLTLLPRDLVGLFYGTVMFAGAAGFLAVASWAWVAFALRRDVDFTE